MPTKLTDNVLSWATDLDEKTREQAERSASLPFIPGPIALMPDAHYGYGATVGSVIPTKGAVVPSAVGVDIGCGMIAARLDLVAGDLPDDLQPLHGSIARAVPAGVGKGHWDVVDDDMPDLPVTAQRGEAWWTDKLARKAREQFGSLGSGNHFVEICLDEADRVWIVLHSGSRGVGNQLANIHIDGAKDIMKQRAIELPDRDLAYLSEGTAEFDAYIADMLWSQRYAMGNRQRMLTLVHECVERFLGRTVAIVDEINCHHNFTELETHRIDGVDTEVWLTRKGAIRARVGDRGVIPGSMGAQSFIVSGRGAEASYQSCSHGAGRRMSRTAARKRLDVDTLRAEMRGKAWNQRDAKRLIDEDPRAYKDIGEVMAAQADLVTIEHTLHQILNYKGT
ncbi:MAG: RtcB family protein [Ilumatobacter sp.]|uniref:RtcB family protein n=1 Tax=Ilumatobacter sp. TaxID=1967498 RepID=UPI0026318754|nr:RtcB family protein [Ilumatobacter sp.]MDJ0767191.1 RtcB family protein [Ilumatobacter sp.]